jgi:peptidoglycan hydrolase CwlO-like protein
MFYAKQISQIQSTLAQITSALAILEAQGIKIMSGLTDMQAAVAALQTLSATVVSELQTLQNAAGDPDATVETLAESINNSMATIQAALPPASTAAAASAAIKASS